MNRTLIDADSVLSEIDQWNELEAAWGTPVDLETEDQDIFTPEVASCFSTLDKKPTFDSGAILKKMQKKFARKVSKKLETSNLGYEEFLQELDMDNQDQDTNEKQFYFVGGNILSAMSVNDICNKIDAVFKSIEKLSTLTSTVRLKKNNQEKKFSDIVACSMSTNGLSFDDTKSSKADEDMDAFIDQLFDIDKSIISLQCSVRMNKSGDEIQESVSTLVRKFSSFLENPVIKCSRKRRNSSKEKFKELADFWKNHIGI